MKKRPIGSTGLSVTPIGFGTAALGGMPDTYGYGVDDETAYATVREILDGPVNLIDTSRNYGFGRSEERIGKVIRERGGLPDGFVISTKLDRDMETGQFDGDRVRRSAEESLAALGIDRFQILHLHDPEHARSLDEITRTGGALDTLFRLKEEGLVEAAGIAMGRTDVLLPLLRDWPFDIVLNHNRFTLLNRSAQEAFALAQAKGMTVFNAAPYAGGVLAKGSDRVKRITYQVVDEEALAPVRRIEEVCSEYGAAPGAVALQFSMRQPFIGSTIVGVSKPERVRQTIEWATASMDDDVWKILDELVFETDDPEATRVYVAG
ncbi:aldo/keto reductase [Rhodobacterales bacterium HKCCSP123]|nr:aldo/keto reductase [Rhodobacterales bacterium HKCCSP123]